MGVREAAIAIGKSSAGLDKLNATNIDCKLVAKLLDVMLPTECPPSALKKVGITFTPKPQIVK